MSACTHDGNCEVDHAAEDDADAAALAAGRHPKWRRVEPLAVIPVGCPYRVEKSDRTAFENVGSGLHADAIDDWFVDSSWKAPLVLPTKPTWGIAVNVHRYSVGEKWGLGENGTKLVSQRFHTWPVENVIAFIPYTAEQVAQIEGHL